MGGDSANAGHLGEKVRPEACLSHADLTVMGDAVRFDFSNVEELAMIAPLEAVQAPRGESFLGFAADNVDASVLCRPMIRRAEEHRQP